MVYFLCIFRARVDFRDKGCIKDNHGANVEFGKFGDNVVEFRSGRYMNDNLHCTAKQSIFYIPPDRSFKIGICNSQKIGAISFVTLRVTCI